MPETFTEGLRRRTRERVRGMSAREAALAVGVPHMTLWHFLNGRPPSAALIDRLDAALRADSRPEQPALLDVERLARALGGKPGAGFDAYLHMAETAARQYANDRPDSERGDL